MSLVRTRSLAVLTMVVSALLPATASALAGCESYIAITQLPTNPTYQSTGNFRVEYGTVVTTPPCFEGPEGPITIDPATFRFTINGVDRTSYFTTYAGYAIATNVPLVDEATNTFRATVTGYSASGAPRTDADQKSGYVDTTPLPNSELKFYNYASQKLDACAVSCFAAVYAQSTVPYYSMSAPRSVTLVYHGDRVSRRPFLYVDVTQPAGSTLPTKFSLKAMIGGVERTFTNGEQQLYFTASSQTIRLAGQLDVSDLDTRAYDMQVIVTSYYTLKTESQTIATKLVVVNERKSLIARGWTLAGVQKLYVQADSSLLITEGNGSAVYYEKCGTNCYLKPAGEFSSLTFLAGSYTRAYPDSSKVTFNSAGQMVSVRDRFGTLMEFTYDGLGRLIRYGDPFRKYSPYQYVTNSTYSTLEYGTDALHGTPFGLKRVSEPDGNNFPGLGRTTTFEVSDSSLVTFIDPDGVSTRYQYDAEKRLATVINRRGDTLRYHYNALSWKLDSIQSPSFALDPRVYPSGPSTARLVTRYRPWQGVGVPTTLTVNTPATPINPWSVTGSVTDAGGHTTVLSVNLWGQPTQIVDPFGNSTGFSYVIGSPLSMLPISVSSPTGAVDTYQYTPSGQVSEICKSGSPCVSIRYGGYNQVDSVWSTAAWGPPSERRFLGVGGRVDSVRFAGRDSLKTRYTYDTYGRVLSVKDPRNHIVYYHYDAKFGNLDSSLSPGSRASIVRFDQYGRDSASKRTGQPWSWKLYDLVNRPTTMNNGMQPSTVLAYDPLFLLSVTDPKSQVYRFEYNALGLMTKRHDPVAYPNRFESFAYDAEGLLTTRTNRRGQAMQFTYDTLHRMVSRSGTNTSADSLGYSRNGRISVGWNAVSRDSSFSSINGWLDSTVTNIAGKRFRQRFVKNWNAMLLDSVLVTSTSSPVIFATRSYTRDLFTLRLLETKVGNTWTQNAMNADGRRDTTSWAGIGGSSAPNFKLTGSHTATHREYKRQYSSPVLGPAFTRGYGYDVLDRIREDREVWTPPEPSQRFAYDSAGQLVGVDSVANAGSTVSDSLSGYAGTYDPASANILYTYDNAGNRTSSGGTYGTGNRITSFGGGNYQTDLDGNVLNKFTTRYHWSADGLLDSVVAGGCCGTIRYRYNTARQLVEKSRDGTVERIFLWQGDNLLAELNGTATARIAEYAYDGLDQPTTLITGATTIALQRFFVQNELGNVTGVIQDSLTIAQKVSYDPWGMQLSVTGTLRDTTRLRWKGLVWEGDATQLYYVRNRWYDPETGRFMTEDPIGLAGGINLYVFADNDPVNGSDPYGLDGDCRPSAQKPCGLPKVTVTHTPECNEVCQRSRLERDEAIRRFLRMFAEAAFSGSLQFCITGSCLDKWYAESRSKPGRTVSGEYGSPVVDQYVAAALLAACAAENATKKAQSESLGDFTMIGLQAALAGRAAVALGGSFVGGAGYFLAGEVGYRLGSGAIDCLAAR